jgi:hypothetical protein
LSALLASELTREFSQFTHSKTPGSRAIDVQSLENKVIAMSNHVGYHLDRASRPFGTDRHRVSVTFNDLDSTD